MNEDWKEGTREALEGAVGDFDKHHPEVAASLNRLNSGQSSSMRVYRDFHIERIRAHAKHAGGRSGSMEQKDWADPIWLPVVMEEVGEVARVLCENELGNEPDVRSRLREELVQVGAMVAAWIAALDGGQPA